MIKNVIFDFGGVLITFDPHPFLQALYQDEEKARRCYDVIVRSPEWNQMDRGLLRVEEAQQRFILREPGLKAEILHFFQNWEGMFQPLEDTVAILAELKARGVGLFAISNFIEELWGVLSPRFSFFTYFEGIVLSYQLKMAKPDLAIYAHCLQEYNLRPEECLFIDDLQANVEGAKHAGLHALPFQSSRQLRQHLQDLNLL